MQGDRRSAEAWFLSRSGSGRPRGNVRPVYRPSERPKTLRRPERGRTQGQARRSLRVIASFVEKFSKGQNRRQNGKTVVHCCRSFTGSQVTISGIHQRVAGKVSGKLHSLGTAR